MSDPTASRENPYVGLRPFFFDDRGFFFGRDEQTTQLLETLYQERFLAVVGSSGCGKSSLVRAGLIPMLLGGFLTQDRIKWSIARMKPGDEPVANLAAALADAATALSDRGLSIDSHPADVASESDVRSLVDACADRLGGIDMLVNNAGVFPAFSVRGMSTQDLDRVVSINLRGPVMLTRDVAEVMIAAGTSGRILNITSIDALHPSRVGLAV